MYLLKYSSRFKKDLKHYRHDRSLRIELEKALDTLTSGKQLLEKYHNHRLTGEFRDCFECHVKSDALLIYMIKEHELIVLLLRIGSHEKLFG